MNMAVPSLATAMVGGDSASVQSFDAAADPAHDRKFSQMVDRPRDRGAETSAPAQRPESKAQTVSETSDQLDKVENGLQALEDLDRERDLGLSKLTLQDFVDIMSGDLSSLEQLNLSAADLEALMGVLDGLRAQIAKLSKLMASLDMSAEMAQSLVVDPEAAAADGSEPLVIANVIEVVQGLKQQLQGNANQAAAFTVIPGNVTARPQGLTPQGMNTFNGKTGAVQTTDLRPTQTLSLVSDIHGISLPEQPVKETVSFSPMVAAAFSAMTNGAAQAQQNSNNGLSTEIERAELPLALTQRPDMASIEQFEQSQPATQSQKTDNNISTKFANVLINQVRNVDIQEGTTRIELAPRGLGSVEVEMRTNSDGSLAIVVRAENHAVLSSLREESDLLASIIANNGSASLDFQEFDQGEDGERQGQSSDGVLSETGAGADDQGAEATRNVPVIGGATLDLMT